MSNATPGPRRAVKGPDNGHEEWHRSGCGFVLAPDGKTVVGRFPRFEDAVLDAAAPDLLAALKKIAALDKHSGASLRDRAASEIARAALSKASAP